MREETTERERDIEITTNAQKFSAIRHNIVNILMLIMRSVQNQLVSERITCKSRPINEKN